MRERVTQKGNFCVTLDSEILMYVQYTAVSSSSQALKFLLLGHSLFLHEGSPPYRFRQGTAHAFSVFEFEYQNGARNGTPYYVLFRYH